MSPTAEQIHRRRWWILATLCLSLLMVFVGNASLNIAIPTLSEELGATQSQLQWVIAAYSLVFAGLLLTSGAIGDRFGRKGILQAGMVIFLASSLTGTFATATWQIIAARAIGGVGAALIMPSTLSILVNVFPPEERGKAIASWAAVAGVAGGLGPVTSGFLLAHFWYGSIFLTNVPIIVVAFVAGAVLVPKTRDPESARLDPLGAVLSTVGIVAIVYGLIEAPDKGWTSGSTVLAFAVGIVVLTAFTLWELRLDEPMLDVRLFRQRAFSVGTGGMILVFMAMYGVMFLVTQYLQLVHGYSALGAAVRLLPAAPVMIMVAPFTPRLSERFGANRVVAFGMLVYVGGLALLWTTGVDSPYLQLLAAMVLTTAGFGLTMSPMTAAIMSAVPPRRAGSGSAMNDASRELGAALGVAVMGSIAASRYQDQIAPALRGLPAQAAEIARSSLAGAVGVAEYLAPEAGAALRSAAQHAFVSGFHAAIAFGAMLSVIAAVITWRLLPNTFLHQSALHDPIAALEDVAELGLGGALPAFADEPGVVRD